MSSCKTIGTAVHLHDACSNHQHAASLVAALARLPDFDPNVLDNYGGSTIAEAARSGNVALISAIGKCPQLTLETCYSWDCNGQTALYLCHKKEEVTKAILDLPGFSLLDQLNRLASANTIASRRPLRAAVDDNLPSLISIYVETLRSAGHLVEALAAGLFDATCTGKKHEPALIVRASQLGHSLCTAELYLAGVKTNVNDILPAIVGPTSHQVLTRRCCAAVEKRFLADFADGDVTIQSVEHNRSGAGLSDAFCASLMMRRSSHGRVPTTRFLWHSSSVPDLVCKQGLNSNFSSFDLNVYGVGLYFATDAKLSAAYSMPDDTGVCTMLLVLTLLGKVGVREPLVAVEVESNDIEPLRASMDSMGVKLTQPQHRNPPIGCDSAMGPHAKEVVVYNSAQTMPAFIVRYRLNRTLENPYLMDTKSRRGQMQPNPHAEYLRPLSAVPELFVPDGFEGELDVLEDAKLLPMGTFPTTRAEARELRRRVVEEGYNLAAKEVNAGSTREELWSAHQSLADENNWLKERLGELELVEAENQQLKLRLAALERAGA